MNVKPFITVFAMCGIALLVSNNSFANGGGGGGGGGGFSTPSQSAPAFDPVETYQQAVADLRAGENKKAAKGFKKVLTIDRKNSNTQYLYGIALYNQGKYKRSIKPFKRAVKYKDGHIMARGYLTSAYQLTGKDDESNEYHQALVKQQASCNDCKEKRDLDMALRVAAGPTNNTTSALPQFNDGLGNSVFGDNAYLTAVASINKGDYQAALESLFQSSIAFGPHPDVLTYLGFVNRKMGNMDEALHYYQAALSIQDNHRGANEYLGEYYVELGQLDLAKVQLEKLDSICAFGCEEVEELRQWIERATS